MNKFVSFVAALGLAGLVVGCGPQGPGTVPAEGTVTLKGTPLANAGIIVNYPDNNVAQGSSDDKGKFTLTYLGHNGALAGAGLKVSVYKVEGGAPPAAAPAAALPTGPPSDEEMRKKMKGMMKTEEEGAKSKANVKAGAKSLIDTKYNSPSTSGLTLTIPPNGSKDLKIDLQ